MQHLLYLFTDSIDNAVVEIRKYSEPFETVDLQLVIGLCNLLESFLKDRDCAIYKLNKLENRKRFLNYIFGYSFIWTVGYT